jgi:beta-lactamase regulating signal transducer with metallopeptidase domain
VDAVVNWSAQGVVLGLIAAAGLRVIPVARTQMRYRFLWAAYLSLLALPLAAPIVALTRDAAGRDSGTTVAAPMVTMTMPPIWWTSTRVMAGLWSAWFVVHAVALARDVAAVRRAKRQGQPCPCDLMMRLPHWSRVSVTGRPACVVLSNRVHAAGVLGCGAPVIAIAPRLIDDLSATDLDRVLVHEWAHVQRRDDLAHLVQRIVRGVVGWHPAAWWLERRLELEREIACDEVAVRVTGSAKRYAQCLVSIAALKRRPEQTLPVLAAVSRSRLQRRVERIIAVPGFVVMPPWRVLANGSVVGVLLCALALGNVQLVTSARVFDVANYEIAASAPAAEITSFRRGHYWSPRRHPRAACRRGSVARPRAPESSRVRGGCRRIR